MIWGGALILWKSGRQATTSTSTGEAELIAGSLGAQLGLGLRSLMEEAGMRVSLQLWWDNTAAISIATLGSSWRSRHFGVRALALKEYIDRDVMKVGFVPTRDQAADVLTKCLPGPLLLGFMQQYYVGAGNSGRDPDLAKNSARDPEIVHAIRI